MSTSAILAQSIRDFCNQYALFSKEKSLVYANLFASYTSRCSPAEASMQDKCLSGKFLAIFYHINEFFLDQKNALESPHFLNAKQAFLDDFEHELQRHSSGQKKKPKMDYFIALFDDLWKEMTLEATWFGAEPPSLEEYKRNREVTITVHPFVEMYRTLRFPNVEATHIRELVSLVAQVIYHDNDLRSKDDEKYAKPNLVSLVMAKEGVDIVIAKAHVLRDRNLLFDTFQQSKAVVTEPSLHPFLRFLDQCIDGNNSTMNTHQERYAPL